MPIVIESGIEAHLRHSHELPVKLGARGLHTKGRDDDHRICNMIASSFQYKYMNSRVLGKATGHGQARSAASYDDKIIGCFQFCDRGRHSYCRRAESVEDQSLEGSIEMRVVYDDDDDDDDDDADADADADYKGVTRLPTSSVLLARVNSYIIGGPSH